VLNSLIGRAGDGPAITTVNVLHADAHSENMLQYVVALFEYALLFRMIVLCSSKPKHFKCSRCITAAKHYSFRVETAGRISIRYHSGIEAGAVPT
jgi:hypothetical protein